MTEAPETAPCGKLFAALAALQAELPRVGKSADAKIPGKDGKQGYAYRYADLADVANAIMPLLGRHGLAFTAKPTMVDGEFGLAYALAHSSGESDGGFYPLPNPKETAPQQVGSAITYARRYCLCAVTGVAPDGDDDDAGAAQAGFRSAGEAFAAASPARPSNGNSKREGQVSRPAKPAAPGQPDGAEEKAVEEWAAKIDTFVTPEDADKADAELRGVFQAGGMSPTTANAIRRAIRAKRDIITSREPAGAA